MRARPRLDMEAEVQGRRPRLQEIAGIVPALNRPIPGCPFAPRCSFAKDRCHVERPPLSEAGSGHLVACWERARVEETALA
jgi:peptide/nickel transport system ATP-binding protein